MKRIMGVSLVAIPLLGFAVLTCSNPGQSQTDPGPKVVAEESWVGVPVFDASTIEANHPATVLTYDEPDDPAVEVLSEAGRRIYSDDGKDYTVEANERGLRALDEAIAIRPDNPELHWYRNLTLDRLKRRAEARAAREAAIRLARQVPGGRDLLWDYEAEHAMACASEGDTTAAAVSFLARLDLGPINADFIARHIMIRMSGAEKSPKVGPVPGPVQRERDRLEAIWGPLDRFFETHAGPADAAALARVAQRVQVGMDYREVARLVGFPSIGFGFCHGDHKIPVMDACWNYSIAPPPLVHQDIMNGAPPEENTHVHVVIVNGRVKKVETTRGGPPEEKSHAHAERASFEHHALVASLAFSPDGKWIAVGDLTDTLTIRDVNTGRETLVLRIPPIKKDAIVGWLNSTVFSPDGKIIATGGLYDRTVRLWDFPEGRPRAILQVVAPPTTDGSMDHVGSIAFSPDGKTLATAGPDRSVRLWDVATSQLRARLQGHSYDVAALTFSPDGKTLVSGDSSGTLRFWDLASGRPRDRWPGYGLHIEALAFSPDGKILAVGRGPDRTVRLFDPTTGRLLADLANSKPHGGQCMAFSPDGKTLVVAGAWEVATVWNPTTGQQIGVLEGHSESPKAVAFSPDGKTIATGSGDGTLKFGNGTLKFWDVPR